MERHRFVRDRQASWERLDALVRLAGGNGLDSLSADDLFQLGDLYRATAGDLAIARRDFPRDRVTLYLNALLARAHPVVYRDRVLDWTRVRSFVRYGFPAAYREAGRYIALAFATFLIGAIVAAVLVAFYPPSADVLVPGSTSLRAVMAGHHLWVQAATADHSVAQSFITLNNVKVAFLASAGGMTIGLLSFWVLLQNGIMLGGVGAMVAQYNLSVEFWSFVVPHGVIELSVIFISGGAGFRIADALLRPGLKPRGVALGEAARHAAYLLAGCVPLLMVAGALESWFSPSTAPPLLKFIVGIGSGVLLYAYVLLSGPPTESAVRYHFDEVNVPPTSVPVT